MDIRDEIGTLAAALGTLAADVKDHQDKLLSYARELESAIGKLAPEVRNEKANLEIRVAQRTVELSKANDVLKDQAAELAKRNREITLFSKMNDFLQTSTTEAEAYSIISETVTQLFPGDSGAVFVLNASRNMLEAATVWGPQPPATLIFAPNDCWAHRRGQPHLAIDHERWCPHVGDEDPCMFACRCWRRRDPRHPAHTRRAVQR